MHIQPVTIETIPALLWGAPTSKLFIAVHGDASCKEDAVIEIFAKEAVRKGYQVLSFDLPEHGERKREPRLCSVQNSVEDLNTVLRYAQTLSSAISVFACSIGAYFSMLAYKNEPVQQALFLSPVVDMKRIIQNIMGWFNISEEQLKAEQTIETPVKTLYWNYYEYVLQHPVSWQVPTALLYGRQDTLCEIDYIQKFAQHTGASLTIAEEGEHFFHTDAQLQFFQKWAESTLSS